MNKSVVFLLLGANLREREAALKATLCGPPYAGHLRAVDAAEYLGVGQNLNPHKT